MMFSQQAMALAACQALLAVFPGQLYWPDNADYTTASTGVWSKTCVLNPECVFEPQTVVSNSKSSDFSSLNAMFCFAFTDLFCTLSLHYDFNSIRF